MKNKVPNTADVPNQKELLAKVWAVTSTPGLLPALPAWARAETALAFHRRVHRVSASVHTFATTCFVFFLLVVGCKSVFGRSPVWRERTGFPGAALGWCVNPSASPRLRSPSGQGVPRGTVLAGKRNTCMQKSWVVSRIFIPHGLWEGEVRYYLDFPSIRISAWGSSGGSAVPGPVCSADAYENQLAGLIAMHRFQSINGFKLHCGGFSSQKLFFHYIAFLQVYLKVW